MARRYDAYLIRHWSLEDGERVEVLHVGSGRRTLVTSLSRAAAWMRAYAADAAARDPPAGDGRQANPEEPASG
ncbi:MAG TPA: hypothetical protein VIL85_27010 [Thermomicrobiales bacterium]|jgi:hypothetical protein